jgi:hypothetical protein
MHTDRARGVAFGLRTFFSVVFVAAVFAAGYQLGFRTGRAGAVTQPPSDVSPLRVILSAGANDYPMSDRWNDLLWCLGLRTEPSFSYLVRLIEATITVERWTFPGNVSHCSLAPDDVLTDTTVMGLDDPFADF